MTEDDDFMSPSEVAEVDAEGSVPVDGEMAGEVDDGGSWGVLEPLMSTEPDVSPREASGAFDPEVSWHKDLECALLKISGSGGMPAIGHLVVAAAKVGLGQDASLPSIGGGGDGDGDDRGGDPDVIGGDEL